MLEVGASSTSWDDIGGVADAKQLLNEAVVLPLIIPDYFVGIREPWKGTAEIAPRSRRDRAEIGRGWAG